MWTVHRENKGQRVYRVTKVPLVLLVCLEKEVDQEMKDIKGEEEIQDYQDPKDLLENKAKGGYKG